MFWLLTFNRALIFAQSLKSIACVACARVINEDEQEDIHEERGKCGKSCVKSIISKFAIDLVIKPVEK